MQISKYGKNTTYRQAGITIHNILWFFKRIFV